MVQSMHTYTLRFNGHFSRWTWLLPPSFSIYSQTMHPFGTGLNFPCQPAMTLTF